jgi:hypothetical protein
MLHKLIFTHILIYTLTLSSAWAGFRASMGLGLGQTKTSNEITDTEGPFTTLFTVDYVLNSRQLVGLEHLRSLSLSPTSTSMSFTGIYFNYYLNAIPTPNISVDRLDPGEVVFRDIGYFIGAGIGLGQSNNLPDAKGKTSNSAGVYLSPRIGADIQLTKSLGARSEVIMATSMIGTGSLASTSWVASLFWCF